LDEGFCVIDIMEGNHQEKYSVEVGVGRNLGADLRVSPEEGENDLAVVEHTLPPRKLAAPLHRHSCEDEISYILEGTMGVQEGESVSTVSAGEFAVKGRNVWHTFWNPGPEQLRFLEIITPGEFAWYFKKADETLPETGEPDEQQAQQLAQLHEELQFEMKPESVPQLIERHDLEP
jgi:quercetin dioxygenase-like cupin family protein